MLKFSTLLLFTFGISFLRIDAQQAVCGSESAQEHIMKTDPQYAKRYKSTKEYLKSLNITQYKTVTTSNGTEYHIPCVVHVMHTGGAVGSNYNPTDAAIQNFLNHINEGYSNTNDVGGVPGTYNSVSTPFRFYLAQRDELNSCSATTGINRLNMSSDATYVANGVGTGGITDAALKSVVHWNDLDYYNIYIVNKINGQDGYSSSGTYTAGYAYYPVTGGYYLDGMVVLAQQVGFTNQVFIHELGHAFNLKHTFDGGSQTVCPANTDCTVDNDEVCDTDPEKLDFTCNPSGTNVCTGTAWSASNVQFNYMSYNGCVDRFTAGQKSRMNDVIDFIRTGYKNTAAIDAPVTLPVSITAPTYNGANAGNNFNMGPTYFKLNTIEYTSDGYSYEYTGDLHYVDHTCNQATTVYSGNSYPISVKTVLNAQKVAVYIDYDNNGTFTNAAPERVFTSTGASGDYSHTGTITIPSTGVVLNTPLRMRVIADFSSSTITPTMQIAYGQAEDYSFKVMGSPLSLNWRDFSAQLNNEQDALLRWTTEAEYHCDRFELEHSVDGIHFESIYSTPATNQGEGIQHYSFLDKNTVKGNNYYRCKQIDQDGAYTYSDIEHVNVIEKEMNVSLYPNPVLNDLHVDFISDSPKNLKIQVCDISGHVLSEMNYSSMKGNNTYQLPLEHLQAGIYFLRFQAGSQNTVKRFIKF